MNIFQDSTSRSIISNTAMFDIIRWLIGGGFVATYFGFIWKRYFLHKPVLNISIGERGSMQSIIPPNKLYLQWHRKLVVKNQSIYKARNIKLLSTNGAIGWKFKGKFPEFIEPDGSVNYDFEIEFMEDKGKLIAEYGEQVFVNQKLQELILPKVTGNAAFLVSYQNDNNVTFYTLFKLKDSKSVSTCHRVKPNISKINLA